MVIRTRLHRCRRLFQGSFATKSPRGLVPSPNPAGICRIWQISPQSQRPVRSLHHEPLLLRCFIRVIHHLPFQPSSFALEKGACCPGLSSRQPKVPSFGLEIVLLSAPHSSWDFVSVDVVFPFKRKQFLVLPARGPEVCMWLCRAVGAAATSVLPPIPSPEPSSHPARAAGPS